MIGALTVEGASAADATSERHIGAVARLVPHLHSDDAALDGEGLVAATVDPD